MDANTADFFGDSGGGSLGPAITGQAPGGLTAEQLADARARKKAWLEAQGLDENGNQLPAYGTPQSQGGTAQGYATMPEAPGSHVINWAPLGSQDVLAPGTAVHQTVVNTGGAPGVASPDQIVGATGAGDTQLQDAVGLTAGTVGTDNKFTPSSAVASAAGAGGAGRGRDLTAQTAQGVNDLRGDISANSAAAQAGLNNAADDMANANPLSNPLLTQTAANQAANALGPAPTIDQGITDRGLRPVDKAVAQAGSVVTQALSPINQTNVNQATNDARNVLDRLLNGPNTADRIGAQTLRNQLALARSAAGGPGGVQEALRNAQFAAPELEAQAAQSATQEDLAKTQAAGAVTGQLQQTALGQQQNQNQRLATAAQAAGTSAQAAQGARGQDIEIAKANQTAAQNLQNNIAQLTGQQLQLNEQNSESLGAMARDLASQQFNWGQLDAQTQDAEFERWIKAYGIDVAAAAQIKAAAQANDKGVLDYLMPIIGSVAGGLL